MENNKSKVIEHIIIISASVVLIYFLISWYFTNHFFLNTMINGVDVSLKSHKAAERILRGTVVGYELKLIERYGKTETISGRDIGLRFNDNNSISKVYHLQNSLRWPVLLLKNQKYYVKDLCLYEEIALNRIIEGLDCLTGVITEPENVSFIYSNGSYDMVEEEYGNKINKDQLVKAIKTYILIGKTSLDLNKMLCYENPKYTFRSSKTLETRKLLNKYVSANITYKFGKKYEMVDGNILHEWLRVDDNLDVIIDQAAVREFISGLSEKYDTAGATRSFKTSVSKIVEVKGGLYGWKINRKAEVKALTENISLGKTLIKEPVYSSKALSWDKDDIGNTYVEINITKQHLWFYKKGELIADGSVVTGNPNKGNSTVVGTYTIVYKEKGSTLSGPGYDVSVKYWMPFYGNMGIHDASWRSSFGGTIYKVRGTHGCVNAPFYLAKKIYENIEEGTPVVIYKEE